MELKSWVNNKVIFADGETTIKKTLENAVKLGADLTDADLRNANLTEANLTDAHLTDAQLTGANLAGANLTKTYLSYANLTNAHLTNAQLTGANLTGSDLTNADLTNANLTGADLTNAQLTGANLTGTCLDPNNVPNGDWAGFEEVEGGSEFVMGYRTKKSIHVGNTVYEVGKTYEAPYFSTCPTTSCHPGLYLYPSKEAALKENQDIVKVVAKKSELHHAGDKWRCKKFYQVENV